MKWLAFLVCAASVMAASPTLTFIKAFPGSEPAYESITVQRTGDLVYKEAEDDNLPVSAHLSEAEVSQLFRLASELDNFKTPVEAGVKVAMMGKKTFRYTNESGAVTQTVFNYTLVPAAQQLLDRFEQIAATERAYSDLDRTAKFDKLGVNDSLAQIESLWLQKKLAAPEQFIPLLERISSHDSYMHLARERAARLKDAFSAPPAVAAAR